MVDLVWPADLWPYKCQFYLQPHVGGSESPLTRVRKVYGLSAPRWVCKLVFRGGYAGAPLLGDQMGFGPRLDALITDLEGGLNRIALHDFRRTHPLQPRVGWPPFLFAAAAKGATTLVVSGLAPGAKAFSKGDYVGGDGRPHIVTGGPVVSGAGTIIADAKGTATITIRPPLSAAIAAGTPLPSPVTGMFRLTGEDAGQNDTEVGQASEYTLDFVEDLS